MLGQQQRHNQQPKKRNRHFWKQASCYVKHSRIRSSLSLEGETCWRCVRSSQSAHVLKGANNNLGVDSALLPSCLSDTSSSIPSHSSNHNFLTNININLRGVNNSDHRFTD